MFDDNFKIDYKKELNPQQYEAVWMTEGPLMILAGAGSGKTRTLIYRVSYLIESGIDPHQILLLTFTNKAANEMKERAAQMLDERCREITACTYHSFCSMMLRKYARLVGLPEYYTIIDGGDGADIISMCKTELGYGKLKGFPKAQTVLSIISMSINRNWSIARAVDVKCSKYKGYVAQIEKLQKAYTKYKLEAGMVDYDDMLVYFLYILRNFPKAARTISETYRYIMVDEYQDTNYIQEQIVLALRKDNRNLAIVGDDYQSIYGFRGSNVENILTFPNKMPGCQVVRLTQNYRSSQEILDLSNHVMKNHATEGYAKELVANHSSPVKPKIINVDDVKQEAFFILEEIERQHSSGVPYGEICILIRNAFQSYQLETMLTHINIPYEKYGGIKFVEKSHVKDALAYLRCMTNPKDEIAWYRLLQLHAGIGKSYARNISRQCRDRGSEALLSCGFEKRKFHEELVILYQHIEGLKNLELEAALNSIISFYYELNKRNIKEMDTDEETREELDIENERNKLELKTLITLAESFDNPVIFLDEMCLNGNSDKNTAQDTLVISTIHSAKGLEFSTVFIMDCIDEVCPSTTEEQAGTPEDNEELRCFYVAMTRAREYLFLMVPRIMIKYGRAFPGKMSHFLGDAAELIA